MQVSLQPSEGAKSAEARAAEQGSPTLPEQGHRSSGDCDRGSRDRDCQTRLQGLGTAEARPRSQVRGLWSPRFPGIPAGCFWQGPRNEASATALCLAQVEVLKLCRVCAGRGHRAKALVLGRGC